MPISSLFATATPANSAIPISDGSGSAGTSLDLWVSSGSGGGGPVAAEDVTYSNGSSGLSATNVQDAIDELALSSGSGGGSGTVTTVSVATANGFAGSVSNPTTTPQITIETTETGVLVGDGTAVSGIAPGTSGNVLTSNGSSWQSSAPAGGGTPGGSTTQLQYNNAGAFGGVSGATTDGTNVTFGSTNLRATSPRFTTDISDSNGNEVLKITATGSAVNEFTVINAATGNNPQFAASGSDPNVSIFLVPQGTGNVTVNGTNPVYSLAISGTGKGLVGIATGANDLVTGSVTDDFVLRNIASQSFLFSVDNGTSWQMKLATSTGQGTFRSTAGNHNQFFLDTTDSSSVSTWINFQRGGTTYARAGTVGAAGNLIVGSAVGEMALVAFGARMLFSADSGTTIHLQMSTTGNLISAGSITTAVPSGGTAAAWKFGTVASVSPTAPNRTIELDVNGTRYFLAAKTTND